MTHLVAYDQARILLAEAKAVDDVKQILDKAVAMKEYARRAEDRSLEIDAAEIRFHAERRLGQMIAAQKAQLGLASGGQPYRKSTPAGAEGVERAPTLAEIGISHKLSSHAQKMAAVPAPEFEARLGIWRDEVSAAGNRVTMDLLKIGEEEQQRLARRDLGKTLSDTSAELAGQRQYPCVYADPAWRRKAGEGNRSYENHYRTMSWDEILALPVKQMMLPDSWLFLWLPRAHLMALHKVRIDVVVDDGEILQGEVRLPLAWAIARAWGCDEYSTCFIWTKTDEDHEDEVGTGLVVRDQDEVLCLFKRGRGLPKPASDEKFGSNHRERSRPLGHSRKPQFYREMIATMVGADAKGEPLPVLELFARDDKKFPLPPNWATWGNQSAPDIPENIPDDTKSQAKEPEASAGSAAATSGCLATGSSRPADGRSSAATSELMDVTGGESAALHSDVSDLPDFLRWGDEARLARGDERL